MLSITVFLSHRSFIPAIPTGTTGDPVVEGEVREALFEWHQRALRLAVMALGVERHRTAGTEAPVDMMEEGGVLVQAPVYRDVAAHRPDRRPLHAMGDKQGGVAKEMDAGLDGKGGEQGKAIEPVQVVGDDYVGALSRDVLAACNPDSKQQMKSGEREEPYDAVGQRGVTLDGQQIRRRRASGLWRLEPPECQGSCLRSARARFASWLRRRFPPAVPSAGARVLRRRAA